MSENHPLESTPSQPVRPRSGRRRRRAFDPFFVFTYTLLALAGLIQLFVMISMDLF